MTEIALNTARDDGFAVEEKLGESLISGRMIKFSEGNFTIDKIETLPPGTQLIVMAMATVWVHWDGGKPVEQRITRAGESHPDRGDLPDQDNSLWPPGLNDKPEDPWKDTRYVHLIDPNTGSDYTFITDSIGGRRAVSDLKRQIANKRATFPEAFPIVTLVKSEMKTKFGRKLRPDFKVVGWHNAAQPKMRVVPPKAADMDDDIPF
ncbi:hypothetical protein [Bradyrhizobium sp. AUGA SZCCT0042]|uniref:hypothetical protein n=1 Tax=Bradyrhizobium sp. AUGA SZCCT0042 TaxID=2807651 RepID=UPI001BAAF5C2|nr:hypothetical protein [Bradyrhizobium sp. AUGA SZCCT0042]MBR1301240.1 hypothetical protein [Bradyrhizobium sp. AUGA SZCCT0042]